MELTVAQKVRPFLDVLQATPPATASSREIEALLISRVRARRDDSDARRRLRDLLADLAHTDAARLPAPQCETLDPSALAGELEGLLAGGAAIASAGRPRPSAAMFAAALLLFGAAAGAGCGPDNKSKDDCASDTSVAHFNELVSDGTGLSSAEISQAQSEYDATDRSCEMHALCKMSPEEIANRVKTNAIGTNYCGDDDNGDHHTLYKGVSF
jgi:hypothetical protein